MGEKWYVRTGMNGWLERKKKTDVQLAKEQIFTRMRRRFLEKIKVQNVASNIKKIIGGSVSQCE